MIEGKMATPAPTGAAKNTTSAKGSIQSYAPSGIKDVPVIAADVYSHLPAFYQAALEVMARNGHCQIGSAE